MDLNEGASDQMAMIEFKTVEYYYFCFLRQSNLGQSLLVRQFDTLKVYIQR
jgi:hypothetical protein